MPFQTQVYVQPAPAVAGDFASANPRFTVLAGPGGLVSGAAGVTVGHFAWTAAAPVDPDGSPTTAQSTGAGPVAGFVHREQQGLITTFLAESGMQVPQGFPVTLMSGGDFWVKNDNAAAATVGMVAYARLTDGAVLFAVSGTPPGGTVATKWLAQSAGAAGALVKMSDHLLG